jgi:cell division protease FtsH
MFDDDFNQKNNDNRGQKKPPGGFNVSSFTWVAWIAIVGCIVAWMLLHSRFTTQPSPISESDFLKKFEANQIKSAIISENPQSSRLTQISGSYFKADKDGNLIKPLEEVPFAVEYAYLTDDQWNKLIRSDKITLNMPNPMLSALGYQLLFFLGIAVLFWFFFIRQIKIAGKGALSF